MMKGKAKIPTKRSKYLDNPIAYHEAGHAVMAFYRGGRFDGIAICENVSWAIDGMGGAVVNLKWPSKKGTRKNKGLVLLAGMSAVAILRECPDEYREDRNKSDIDEFFKLWPTKKLGRNNWQKFYLEDVQFLSRTTVWRQVEVVATTLLKKRRLTYGEVKLCIESVVDKKRKNDFETYLELTDTVCHHR
jgi:hypothetical protein